MTVHRQGRAITFECDCCDELLEGEPHEEFADLWASAKRNGWRAEKVADEWVHECPNCH